MTEATSAIPEEADRAHVDGVVAGSGTSFFWAMRLLPRARRDAMFAIYAFCREVDDIADEPNPVARKLSALAEWRAEIERLYAGQPSTPTGRALLQPVRDYELRKADFLAVIEGMEMDTPDIRAPSMAELERYCDRVACAVGRLSVRAFGAREAAAEDVAAALGRALQLTNILRDLREDAERGRLYLPKDLLTAHGIEAEEPELVLADPAVGAVCDSLAEMAANGFHDSLRALASCAHRPMRPAVVMMEVYRRLLERLRRRGWARLDQPVAVPKVVKVWVALRFGLL